MTEKYQMVIITLEDNTKHYFTGRATLLPGETRKIIDIKFTEPKDLPKDCSFGSALDHKES